MKKNQKSLPNLWRKILSKIIWNDFRKFSKCFQNFPQKQFFHFWIDRKNIFRKSWKFFRTSRSKQNFMADRMGALSASENHPRSPPRKNYIYFPLNVSERVPPYEILCEVRRCWQCSNGIWTISPSNGMGAVLYNPHQLVGFGGDFPTKFRGRRSNPHQINPSKSNPHQISEPKVQSPPNNPHQIKTKN